ncbi:MAG: DUF2163 domain-containing protein [Sandarakinorhabdus sp.]|nr:DUF2163 domain-containing protein [Sandarakinorhabdus sp.]
MSRLVKAPLAAEADATIRRLEPAYWTVDFNIDMMATVVTTGPNALRMRAVFRTNKDLMGLIWQIEDRFDHPMFAYPRRTDWRGVVISFDWASSGIRAMDRLQSVTLTVETNAGPIHYVRLWNYRTSGTPSACSIAMTLGPGTKSGFNADTLVPWHDVKRLFISLQPAAAGRGNCTVATSAAAGASSIHLTVGDAGPVAPGDKLFLLAAATPFTVTTSTSGATQTVGITPPLPQATPAGTEAYVETAAKQQIGEQAAEVTISNVSVTGPGAMLLIRTTALPAHDLAMTDGFDNAYPLTPERIVEQVHRQGYRGPYVLYMGISKFHSLSWNAGEARYVVDPAKPKLSAPAEQWIDDFFARLHAKGFTIIPSVSFEILNAFMPTAWKQRDYAGNEARTGWNPPSSLAAPTSAAALTYFRDVFLACLARLPGGAAKHFQIGEPWWWDGSFGSRAPHIYDSATQALYVAETGQAVPTPLLTTVDAQPAAQHAPYLAWLRDKLGAATSYLTAQVKATHPTATSYLLIFTPQLLSTVAPMLYTLNFPQAAWASPAFDVLQIEDYDWVAEGAFEKLPLTWMLAQSTLGYPLNKIEYFGGFALLPSDAYVWEHTDQALQQAAARGPKQLYVWSREQVWRDGWVYGRLEWMLYPEQTTLAQLWRIDRTDGQVKAYTSHDRPLTVDGATYQPAGGFDASAIASDADMGVGDVEVLGAIASDDLSAGDLLAGVYDGAAFEASVCDWTNPADGRIIVRKGWLGTVSQTGGSFKAEMRGLAQRLQAPIIEAYSPECRANLGDTRCKVNLAPLTIAATVTATSDGTLGATADFRRFFAAALTQADGFFDYGMVTFTSGASTGRSVEVARFAGTRVDLFEPLGLGFTVGDTFTITPGCDKRLETCSSKFANVVNFRGEPHVPGQDSVLRYPDAKTE